MNHTTSTIPSARAALASWGSSPTFIPNGGDLASTGGRRSSLRAEVVTHLVNPVALLVTL